jgi:glutamate-5-semialdehyde dehydrogenase
MSEEKNFLEGEEGPGPVAIAKRARRAARSLAVLPSEKKNEILRMVAEGIDAARDAILEANRADVLEARTTFEEISSSSSSSVSSPSPAEISSSSRSLLDRLVLDEEKVRAMAAGVRAVAALPDPSGRVLTRTRLDDGLVLEKVSCPIGVLLVVFESRPDAVPQISSLALKSGNAAILRGGRESARSAAAVLDVFGRILAEHPEVPEGALQSVGSRAGVDALLALDEDIDLVIPRGGTDLVKHVKARTRIPVLGHAEGVCHVYVDRAADEAMAAAIVLDAKLQYPAACNAAETLLVHADAARRFLTPLLSRLVDAGIELRACEKTRALAPSLRLAPATENDWRTEYGAPVLAVKIVESLDEAIDHVNRFGSHHTEAIVTDDAAAAEEFLARVDAAGVFHNASTRFADGFRYGFGAEVGVSTSRLHARGPVGLEGLVTYKYVLRGSGQVVATYSGKDAKPFRHEKIG